MLCSNVNWTVNRTIAGAEDPHFGPFRFLSSSLDGQAHGISVRHISTCLAAQGHQDALHQPMARIKSSCAFSRKGLRHPPGQGSPGGGGGFSSIKQEPSWHPLLGTSLHSHGQLELPYDGESLSSNAWPRVRAHPPGPELVLSNLHPGLLVMFRHTWFLFGVAKLRHEWLEHRFT